MPDIIIHQGQYSQKLSAKTGETFLELLQRNGISLNSPCGGGHTCGKCRIWLKGPCSPKSREEAALLAAADMPSPDPEAELRLACFARVQGEAELLLPDTPQNQRIAVDWQTGAAAGTPIYSGEYGIAVDIGTTTLVAYLYRRGEAQPLAAEAELNCQQVYGADVLSRISYCDLHGVEQPCLLIRQQLQQLLQRLCQSRGIQLSQLSAGVITGNTTMLHLASGLPPGSLARAPFTPVSFFDNWDELELPGRPPLPVYYPPCISAYVGADITCSILAAGLRQSRQRLLLVDVGTNGEMALWDNGNMVCCSTAAGPAFEGAGISSGMTAAGGAINKVQAANGEIFYTTVDNCTPIGICGSGLIDAIAALLQTEIIQPSGRLDSYYRQGAPIGDSGIALTQNDIRQVQLAKGAIRAGIDTLLHEQGLSHRDLDGILLCGGFGSYLDPVSAQYIGLLPPGTAKFTKALGNASGAGAGMILQDSSCMEEARIIAEMARAVELSYSPWFREHYLKCLNF